MKAPRGRVPASFLQKCTPAPVDPEMYRRGDETVFRRDSRHVLVDDDPHGIHFRCPCGHRMVYVTSPPHTITFDPDGVLTLNGSVGSRVNEALGRPVQNWCHFWVKGGVAEMCEDAKCPGGQVQ